MARIDKAGFEMGDIYWVDVVSAGVAAVASPSGFPSPWCISFPAGSALYAQRNLPGTYSEYYFQIRFRYESAGIFIVDFRSSNTQIEGIATSVATNKIDAYSGGTLIGSTSLALVPNQIYVVEVYNKIADATNGRFTIKVDQNIVFDFTGDTKIAVSGTIDNFKFGHGALSSTYYADDIFFNDTTGGVDDSWVGGLTIEKIIPDGDGAHNNWHGSDSDDVNNWNLVDEYPLDGDATYVYRSGADSGTQDQYNMTDTWIDTNKVCTRVWAEARARKTIQAAHTLKIGILASGGADRVSAGRALYVNGYGQIRGNEEPINPVTASACVKADIDALQYINEVG